MSVQDSSKNFSSISNPGDKPNANDDKNSKYRKWYERTVQNCWTHVNEKTAFKAKSRFFITQDDGTRQHKIIFAFAQKNW